MCNNLLNFPRCQIQILCPCIRTGYFSNIVVVVECLCRFNNRWRGHILCGFPCLKICLRLSPSFTDSTNGIANLTLIHTKRAKYAVHVFLNRRRAGRRLGGDSNRNYEFVSGTLVEVFQIQRIIHNLLECAVTIFGVTVLKFQQKQNTTIRHNRVHALTHARDFEFQRDMTARHAI